MQSKAKTPDDYIAELPADRKEAIIKLRKEVLRNLPKGFEETMGYGMMGYVVPHSIYPAGYHCTPSDPLPFAGFAVTHRPTTSFFDSYLPIDLPCIKIANCGSIKHKAAPTHQISNSRTVKRV